MDSFEVKSGETGVVRLFLVDLEPAELRLIQSPRGDMPPTGAALGALVGLDWVDPAYAELFDMRDLDGMGLPNFLLQGAGVSDAQVEEARVLLEQVEGVVLILYSGAFRGEAAQLAPAGITQFLREFREEKTDVHFERLPGASASGQVAPPTTEPKTKNPHITLLLALLLLPLVVLAIGGILWVVL